ncbi:indole-3-glycerol phosphate synthase [Thermanaeromonas toyohensis ToBE]|uniref:Indole-3-glycerol phosphate synthase n=1 Tax=Thermanaeromonas toyohensis ToBE TaxID=698762 RepID=A0A1W1VYD5_9FIRM|nr:indole-3-glycerol phosphate synthase TrpC [Thermanaeromonas toyohensis]SMB98346.1 indole-3-glycerol phosphate synthase [Thermanaeromonas toyohensis ToBE]
MLDKILEHKRREVEAAREAWPLAEVEKLCQSLPATRDFAGALRVFKPPALIAELKKASPSRGILRANFHPQELAQIYTRAGAAALSVLTDERFFQGHPQYIRLVRQASPLPVLRKDFIIDAYQVWVSRVLGADAILLIVGALEQEQLKEYLKLASRLGLSALVETHTGEEIERALMAGAKIIGINNRNLRTLRVELRTTLELRPLIPRGILVVSESGIRTREDVLTLRRAGVDALLVGEAFMVAEDIEGKVKELFGIGGDAYFGKG